MGDAAMTSSFYDRFEVPLKHPEMPPVYPVDRPARRRLSQRLRRRDRRRLAVLDTHFPWPLSGFRFHEFTEMHRQRPDTTYFSLHEMAVPFPVPVHRLSTFPDVAAQLGITDVYMVFLNFTLSVLGLADSAFGRECPGVDASLSLATTLSSLGIRAHTTLYPGGGLIPGQTPPEAFEAVHEKAATVFTNLLGVRDAIPTAHYSHAVTATSFYAPVTRKVPTNRITLAFAADDRPRKGLGTLIEAFNVLDPNRFHLHVVGPHGRHLHRLTNPSFTAHGWLTPEALRAVYARSDVFVSPVGVDPAHDPDAEAGMIDGFPTSCALDAMATGCCLVTSNPWGHSPKLESGRDFIEVPAEDPTTLAVALNDLAATPERVATVGRNGQEAVEARFSVASGVFEKLTAMGV